MKRYGSAIIFYGGPGEAVHKYFVKAPGQKTQHRVSKFAVQTANQCCDMMVTKHAMSLIGMEMERVVIQGNNDEIDRSDVVTDLDEISVAFSGKYSLVVRNDILECMKRNDNIYVSWSFDRKNIKKDNVRFCLKKDLVRVLVRKINGIHEKVKVGKSQ
jgi:hypothetical protein